MKDAKNITIALLCVSATLLLTVVLTINGTNSAQAATSESRFDDYLMVAGRVGGSTEMVYIVDAIEQKLNGYIISEATGNVPRAVVLDPGSAVDLRSLFERSSPARGGR